MKNFTETKKLSQKSNSWLISISDSTKIGVVVHLLDIIIKVGKLFPIIFLSLASLNIFLAANDFFANSMGNAIMNSVFGVGDVLFLAQMRLKGHAGSLQSGGLN